MSTLSKKTKGQLLEIAQDLNIELGNRKVKRDIADAIQNYLVENGDDITQNSKYYELATLTKLSSPKKTVFIEIDTKEEDEGEAEVEGEDDEEDETEEADDDQVEVEEFDEDEENAFDDDDDDVDDEDEDDDEDDDDFDYECYTNLVKALKHGTLSEYIELKNYEVRDYLGDPYTLNELAFYLESIVLATSLLSYTPARMYLPASVLEYVPATIADINVISTSSFNLTNLSTFLIWVLTAKFLPLIFSYYVNFTYDFERDAFTESLAKLFFAIIIFKTDFNVPTLKDEVKYNFAIGDVKIETIKHFVFVATLQLREVFGNWILLDALFTSILSLYANLAFV